MDIKPVMSKFGFGHRVIRHIIIDQGGELWLKIAPAALGGFLPMGATSLPGTLRVEPLEDGKAVPYTYTATEGILELITQKGAKVKFAVDKDAGALRIAGNTALRLNGVESAAFVTTLKTTDGIIISAGTTRYFMAAKKGKMTFDDSWILNQFHSVTPVLDVEPVEGAFELYAFDLPADTDVPVVTKTLDACAADNSAEFKAFIDTLVDIPAEYSDVKEQLAYPIWLCHRDMERGVEVLVANKYDSTLTNSWLMSIASMAFKDAKKAIGMILCYPVELPPIAGIAVLRLLEDNLLCDSRGEIFKVYEALEAAARKCIKERTADRNGLSFYAYRFESGRERSPAFFKVGEPVLAPDLNTYLIIVSEVLGKLANMEYDVGAGQKWEARAKTLLSMLIAELWDGDSFIGKNAYTGEASMPDEFLSLIPIILGSRLPQEIIGKLAAQITPEVTNSAMGLLLAGGLFDAGEKDAAREIAQKALEAVRKDGIRCPFYGASLLALAHKVLL
jgi:hypothetical protein